MARYSTLTLTALTALCLGAPVLAPASAQEGIKRTALGSMDFPAGYQTVKGYADIAKGVCAGRHTHPGLETSYVLEQELILKIDGQPDHLYKAGEAFQIPPGVVHDACATANNPVRILTVHIVEKGKPLATLAP
jgi:quercetin dioxygenase-like cupin family protein